MARNPKRRPPANKQSNKLRIIGGQWRGRKLDFADLPGLRPTTDRVRETLFNWLQIPVAGARCLDLFAGSGALGLEALSRGASQATLVDSADAVVRQLKKNLEVLGCNQGEAVQSLAQQWLQSCSSEQAYDLIFLDPPFNKGLLADCCELIDRLQLIQPGGWIYIEAEKGLQPLPVPDHWRLHRQLKAGQASCYLFQANQEQAEA